MCIDVHYKSHYVVHKAHSFSGTPFNSTCCFKIVWGFYIWQVGNISQRIVESWHDLRRICGSLQLICVSLPSGYNSDISLFTRFITSIRPFNKCYSSLYCFIYYVVTIRTELQQLFKCQKEVQVKNKFSAPSVPPSPWNQNWQILFLMLSTTQIYITIKKKTQF